MKKPVMTKKDDEDFKNTTKCWLYDNDYVDGKIKKVRNHCQITGKYRVSANRDCNIKVKLSHEIPMVFHKLNNHNSHLAMQKLGKFDFEIYVIPNRLEKCISFNISNKLIFIDTFQFLNSSLDSSLKNLGKDDFKYLSQEFKSKILHLFRQKGFYSYKYMSGFQKFK